MKKSLCFTLLFCVFGKFANSQMITGVWKGKINKQKVEIKIIQKGDSLTGTSYYYESPNNYRRYSIKGYFDANSNSAVWWDDQLLAEKSTKYSLITPGKIPMLLRADFNCPGGGKMMLDGKAAKKDEAGNIKGDVDLDKINHTLFEDEWDFVIDNYTVGTNDPDIIDSIGQLAQRQTQEETVVKTVTPPPPVAKKTIPAKKQPEEKAAVVVKKETRETIPAPAIVQPLPPQTIEEKFITRNNVFIKEIPVSGDSIELRFYDNAEIDGDSISLFLNGKLLIEHIGLTGNAFVIKLAVHDLQKSNELIMVAENLGSIPPNTSYMVAIVNNKRYDAYLASSEGSSAMIKLTRE